MTTTLTAFRRTGLALAIGACLPASALAGGEIEQLQQQVEALQSQLQAIQAQLAEQQTKAASKDEVQALKKEVKDVGKVHSEWKDASSVVHLAGYGSIGYTDSKGDNSNFNQVQFAPIFHYQYKDLMMLESELEIKNTADGGTSTALEYLSLDLNLNDYATLVAGKFLSPIGQFRQNIHPGWINKLPSAPPGFMDGEAAPLTETGIQIRGGFPLGGMRANYAAYVANGPELEAATMGMGAELEAIEGEGRTADADGKKVFGGRFGLLPMAGLEVGASLATGQTSVTMLDGAGITDPVRDYDVFGGDFAWQRRNLSLRGEYVQSKIGAEATSVAPDGATWKTWYTQASYKFLPTKFEGVVRYADFNSPDAAMAQKQWALGINYLFASNVVAKLAYEFNDGQAGAPADDNSFQAQMAYGF